MRKVTIHEYLPPTKWSTSCVHARFAELSSEEMESRRNEKCPFLQDIKNTWVKKCDTPQLKGSSRCRRGGSGTGHYGLDKNDYSFLTTSKCWLKIHCNGEWYSCLACLLEIMTRTPQNDVFHKLRTLMGCKYCPEYNAGMDKWVCWSDANIASK